MLRNSRPPPRSEHKGYSFETLVASRGTYITLGRLMRPRPKFQKGRLVAVTIIFLACTSPAVSGQPCAACHPKEVQGFLATPMAQSMGPPSRGPSGSFYHDVSNTRVTIKSSPGQMTQRMERDTLTSQNTVAYSVGSGTHAVAYLV